MTSNLNSTSSPTPFADVLDACKSQFVSSAAFSAFSNVLYLFPTIFMLQVYDRVVPTGSNTTLIALIIVLVFALFTLGGLDYLRSRLLVHASVKMDRIITPQILRTIFKREHGSNLSQPLRDFDVLRQTATGTGLLAVFDAPWTPIYIGVCFMLHPQLGILSVIGCVLLVGMAIVNERTAKAGIKRANEVSSVNYASLDAAVGARDIVSSLGMAEAMTARHLLGRADSIALQTSASFSSAGFIALTKVTRMLLQSLSIALGAYLAVRHEISIGAVFAASLLVSRSLAPIEQITSSWKSLLQARTAYDDLKKLLANSRGVERTRMPPLLGDIEMSGVDIGEAKLGNLILERCDFSLVAGQALGVVGPSGAGKSTLVRALIGAVAPSRGSIRYDGLEIGNWDQDELWRQVGYVPQSCTLFRGTIRENICRFSHHLREDSEQIDAEVVAAAQKCGAHDMILRLPNGYETMLGWGGEGLSAGQKQRIALARALFGNPSVLILDEPNANLDAEGERQLILLFEKLKTEKVTVIAVAHRTAILQAMDLMMVVVNGKMEMFGPRDEVVARLQGNPAPPRATGEVQHVAQ